MDVFVIRPNQLCTEKWYGRKIIRIGWLFNKWGDRVCRLDSTAKGGVFQHYCCFEKLKFG